MAVGLDIFRGKISCASFLAKHCYTMNTELHRWLYVCILLFNVHLDLKYYYDYQIETKELISYVICNICSYSEGFRPAIPTYVLYIIPMHKSHCSNSNFGIVKKCKAKLSCKKICQIAPHEKYFY